MLETAATALLQLLQANMPAEVAAMNAEAQDGDPLTDFATYSDFEWAQMPETPALIVLGQSWSVDEESPGYLESDNTVTAFVVVGGGEPQTTRRQTYRYLACIVRILAKLRQAQLTAPLRAVVNWGSPAAVVRQLAPGSSGFYLNAELNFQVHLGEDA